MANKNENLKWAIENDIYIEPQILDYSNRGVYGIFVEDECVYIGRATSLYRRIFQSRGHVRKMRYSEHVSKLMQGLQDKKKISIKVLEIVKNFCHSPLDETSIHYERFVAHLKFWGQRLMQESSSEETDDEELCEMVFLKYADEYKCACEIEKYIKSELHKIVNKSEKMYLTIYVKRIRMDLIKEQ